MIKFPIFLIFLLSIYSYDKIPSFTIDHLKLLPGIYVSRKDKIGSEVLTTFDIRMTRPNFEPVMNNAELHTIEHLGATFLRNEPAYKNRLIYFGPMGCRTGLYMVFHGDLSSKDIAPCVTEMFEFIRDFRGPIPGAEAKDCGNYLDHNLTIAKYESKKFLEEVIYKITDENLNYPK